jgi:hypothetical protein
LKTGVRKDLGVRIPHPPPEFSKKSSIMSDKLLLSLCDFLKKLLAMLKSLTVQDVLLFILIVVTYYYARSTDKMRKLIQRQVIPDIKLEIMEFTFFLLVQEPLFKLSFDLYNKNSAIGYITKPILCIKYTNGTDEEIYPDVRPPINPFYETLKKRETITVNGNERLAKSFDYYVDKNNSPLFSSKINTDNAKFYIKFIDCLGNKCTLLLTAKSGEYKS